MATIFHSCKEKPSGEDSSTTATVLTQQWINKAHDKCWLKWVTIAGFSYYILSHLNSFHVKPQNLSGNKCSRGVSDVFVGVLFCSSSIWRGLQLSVRGFRLLWTVQCSSRDKPQTKNDFSSHLGHSLPESTCPQTSADSAINGDDNTHLTDLLREVNEMLYLKYLEHSEGYIVLKSHIWVV